MTDTWSDTYDADPFTLVHDALWAVLEAREDFTALVKPGNRVKFGGQRRPVLKDSPRAADLPEVRITAGELDPHLFRTSNGSSFRRSYEIEVYTGDWRVTAGVFPVEWAVLRAFADDPDALSGLPFVKSCRPRSGQAPAADPFQRTDGWHTVLAVDVEFWVRTADIQQQG